MATSVGVQNSQSRNSLANVARFIPGVLLLGVIGFAGKVLEQSINGTPKLITSSFLTLNMCSGRLRLVC